MQQLPESSPLKRYAVRLAAPLSPHAVDGVLELEVPTTLGVEAAERRARVTVAAMGWGDLGTVHVIDSRELPREEWSP